MATLGERGLTNIWIKEWIELDKYVEFELNLK